MGTASKHNRFEPSVLKQAARGRWAELLQALGGIDPAVLDGKHHPCPRCRGTDRFRALDDFDTSGAVYCNQCFSERNGDGLAALQWLLGIQDPQSFPQILAMVGEYLNIQPNERGRAKRNRPPAERMSFSLGWYNIHQDFLNAWCTKKPPIDPHAVLEFKPRFGWWPPGRNLRVFAFSAREPKEGMETAIVLLRHNGLLFPSRDNEVEAKSITLGGEGWLWPGTVDDLRAASVIVKCEGISDAFALWSIGLPSGWIVLTNSCGAKSANPKKLDFSFAAGKRCICIGDADTPGQDGIRRFAARFLQAGATRVQIPRLPYRIDPDHGRDLRDWLAGAEKNL